MMAAVAFSLPKNGLIISTIYNYGYRLERT